MARSKKVEPKPQVYLSVASDLKELVRLTTLEGERVVPITYKRNGVGAFGIGYYRVRISFDVEHMLQSIQHDTLYLVLPTPQIQILEQDEGFTIFDVWGESFTTRLLGAKLSLRDENRMKQEAITKLRNELQHDGSIERAKLEAIELLHKMFAIIPGTIVILDNPSKIPIEAQRIPLDQPTPKSIPAK